MSFWLITIGVALIIAALMARVLTLPRETDADGSADLQVYRDQLAEVDRDLERGVLQEQAAERTRIEIGRRILAADRLAPADGQASNASPRSVAIASVFMALAIVGAFLFYAQIGAPGFRDQPLSDRIAIAESTRANRASQSESEAALPPVPTPDQDPQLVGLVEQLRDIIKTRPDDVQGLALLARNEAILGNFTAARAAQEQLIRVKGKDSTSQDLMTLVDIMIYAAGGSVSPEADQVLAAVLSKEPRNPAARYYVGLMHAQTGRPDLAFSFWRPLLEEGPETAPWIPPIRATIESLAQIAGVRYTPPEISGPTVEDIENASQMNPEDRAAMIRGMVDGLAEELATDGGTPQKWAQLLSALGVLGETERAAAIWEEAQQVFGASPDALEIVRNGAVAAGVAP